MAKAAVHLMLENCEKLKPLIDKLVDRFVPDLIPGEEYYEILLKTSEKACERFLGCNSPLCSALDQLQAAFEAVKNATDLAKLVTAQDLETQLCNTIKELDQRVAALNPGDVADAALVGLAGAVVILVPQLWTLLPEVSPIFSVLPFVSAFSTTAADIRGVAPLPDIALADQDSTGSIRFGEAVHLFAEEASRLYIQAFGLPRHAPFALTLAKGEAIRGVTDDAGRLDVFLAPDASFQLSIFQVETGRLAKYQGRTGPAGSDTVVPFLPFLSTAGLLDTDSDGLPDDAEVTVGTAVNRSDTDRDGISDFAELQQGLDPTDGRAFPTGVIANLSLAGEAKGVVVEGSTLNAEAQTAYVATGSYGLAIVDATRFQKPTVLGQLDLAGDAVDVAVDSRAQVAVVAAGTALHFIDVSDSTLPVLSLTVNVPATQVEVADGVAYVAAGNGIETYSVASGELLQVLSLGGSNVTSLAREGAMLYALDAGGVLRAIDIGSLSMSVLGSVGGLPTSKVFVGNGIAYVGAGNGSTGGFATANVSNPAAMTLLSGVDANNIQGQAVVANGSGLAVSVGKLQVGAGGSQVHVLDVRDPTNTAKFVTAFNLSATPYDVAIGAGIAFVADGTGGLQVVNYLPFDNQGQAPTITLSAPNADRDPGTPGIQALEGLLIDLKLNVNDDRQVRNVELLLDGQVVTNDVSFPWTAVVALPTRSATTTTATIQARATDTGGNTTLSDALVVELVPDTFAPTIVGSNLVAGSRHGAKFRTIRIAFSEAMDADTLNAQNIRLLDAQDQAIAPDLIEVSQTAGSVQLTFPTLATGSYHMVIDQSAVTDRAGNALGNSTLSLGQFHIVPVNSLDIVVANMGSNNVSALAGDGAGGFAAARTFATGGLTLFSVAVGDVNGDGNLDIVVPNYTATTSACWRATVRAASQQRSPLPPAVVVPTRWRWAM
jgi:hypothetical protein